MRHLLIHQRRGLIAILPGVLVLGLAACGSDDSATAATDAVTTTSATATAPTTEAFCAELATRTGDDGPFSAFYDRYGDNPTLDDWATGYTLVTDAIDGYLEQMAGLHPSAEAVPLLDTVAADFQTVKQNVIDGADAARAGDQAAFDAIEAKNQAEAVPAVIQAFSDLTALCGATPGS